MISLFIRKANICGSQNKKEVTLEEPDLSADNLSRRATGSTIPSGKLSAKNRG